MKGFTGAPIAGFRRSDHGRGARLHRALTVTLERSKDTALIEDLE
jgi:hypothetical protein